MNRLTCGMYCSQLSCVGHPINGSMLKHFRLCLPHDIEGFFESLNLNI